MHNIFKIVTFIIFISAYCVVDNSINKCTEFVYEWPLTLDRSRIYHPIYHHDLLSNQLNTESEVKGSSIKYRFSTNSLGFKDLLPRDIPLVSSKKRVLVIGDSFAEGYGLPYEDTFMFDLNIAGEPVNTEFLNASVATYSLSIMYYKLKELLEVKGLKFNEVLLFEDISDLQDERIVYSDNGDHVSSYYTQTFLFIDAINFFKKYLPTTQYIFNKIYPFTIGPQNEDSAYLQRERSDWTFDEDVWNKTARDQVPKLTMKMNRIKLLLDKYSIKMTVVVYPWKQQILKKDLHSKQVSIWKNWCEKNNINFINLFPEFIEINSDPLSSINSWFFVNDSHWNKKGHFKVGRALIRQIFKEKTTK